MLIRARGYHDGIKEYLEDGHKSGRDLHRDELDERVILCGDLEEADRLINLVDSDKERYKTFTFSFKETDISLDTIRAIARESEEFLFSAFKPNEYHYYAEAHLPKTQHELNKATGEYELRLTHFHSFVPKYNLLSEDRLDPLGYYPMSKKYVQAFQEYINYKYGLASPQDNRRSDFRGASDVLSKYKGDEFKGKNKPLLIELRDALVDQDITSMDEFKALLAQYGTVEVGKKGQSDEYFKVVLPGQTKAVRFDYDCFRRDFIELPTETKKQALAGNGSHARMSLAQCEALLKEWHEIRAKEAKYINSGSKWYEQYRAMTPEEKTAILAEREAAFYSRFEGQEDERRDSTAILERIGENLRTADRHISAAGRAAGALEHAAGNLADRSVVRALTTVIQRYAGHQADAGQHAEFSERRRPADNVIGQHQADAEERKNARRAENLSEFGEIKRYLDGRRLLAYMARTHGILIDAYEVHKHENGSDLIRCGTRNLNVTDFLTVELHLSWKEAAPILRECYAAQLGKEPEHTARAEPRHSSLWQNFQQWKGGRLQQKAQAWDQQKASEKARPREIRATYQAEKARIQGLTDIKHADRKTALSLARMAKVQAEQALAESVKAERLALKQAYSVKASDLFRVFLQERAQAGDEQALAELRRKRIEPLDRDARAQQLASGADPAHVQQDPLGRGDQIAYRVALNGDVTYQMHGRDVLRDEPRAVKILEDHDRDVLETGLRLALAKFGPRIQARGDEDFQRRIVQVSVDAGLRVEFTDSALKEYRQKLEDAKRAAIEQARAAAQQQAQAKPTTTTKPTTMERTPMEQTMKADRAAAAEQRKHEEKRRYEDALRRAKDVDLPAWLIERGVKIKKSGSSWKYSDGTGEADRIFKAREGNWIVMSKHATHPSGTMDAVAYAQLHTGLSHRQAVEALSGVQLSAVANGQPATVAAVVKEAHDKGVRPDPIVTAINLQEATRQQRATVYQYALDRGISQETLRDAGEQQLIKADHRGLVFLGYDEQQRIRTAETRLLKDIVIEGKKVNKICYEGTDKTFPPILHGNDKDVHFVEGGFDALALRDVYRRENKEPPTTIITGGARTTKWQDNQEIRDLIKNADHVRPWYDNELDKDGKIDAKKQAETKEAHDNQRDIITEIRGTKEGVEEMWPPAGIKDIAEWNVHEAHAYQVKLQQQEEEEAHRPRMGR